MKLQLQVGKSYKTFDGSIVTIISKTSMEDTYPFKVDNGFSYTSEGSFFPFKVSDVDLAEEISVESDT